MKEIDTSDRIKVHEIYFSVQGESSHVGRPCIFIRTSGCKLRCSWCDTSHAFYEGDWLSFDQILKEISNFPSKLVEVTGGEPMEQAEIIPFLNFLLANNYEVLMETGGHVSLKDVPAQIHKIMDIKCPASKMDRKNNFSNIEALNSGDEVKFVIQDRADFDYAVEVIQKYKLEQKCELLLSPVHGVMEAQTLVEWMLNQGLNARFQLQMHKYVWSAETRGV